MKKNEGETQRLGDEEILPRPVFGMKHKNDGKT
jgi:hypothetical protein